MNLPAQVAALATHCSPLDASNRLAALSAKQIETTYAPLALSACASVGYPAYTEDNFYKVLLDHALLAAALPQS